MQDYLAIYNQGNDTINNFIIHQWSSWLISYITRHLKLELNGEKHAKVFYVYFAQLYLNLCIFCSNVKKKIVMKINDNSVDVQLHNMITLKSLHAMLFNSKLYSSFTSSLQLQPCHVVSNSNTKHWILDSSIFWWSPQLRKTTRHWVRSCYSYLHWQWFCKDKM